MLTTHLLSGVLLQTGWFHVVTLGFNTQWYMWTWSFVDSYLALIYLHVLLIPLLLPLLLMLGRHCGKW